MTRLLSRREASGHLHDKYGIARKPSTLAKLACVGGGPPFRRDGRRALYDPSDLAEWAEGLLTPSASSTAEHDARTGRKRLPHSGSTRPSEAAQDAEREAAAVKEEGDSLFEEINAHLVELAAGDLDAQRVARLPLRKALELSPTAADVRRLARLRG